MQIVLQKRPLTRCLTVPYELAILTCDKTTIKSERHGSLPPLICTTDRHLFILLQRAYSNQQPPDSGFSYSFNEFSTAFNVTSYSTDV